MQISFDYDKSYFPAFPVADLTIISPDTNREETVVGLIDSGSDSTQIPSSILQTIGARDIDDQWVSELSGILLPVTIYSVILKIGPLVLYGMEVIGRSQISEVIIGRDVLNQLIVTLNGLAHITEIQD